MEKWLKIIILFFVFFLNNFSLSNADINENVITNFDMNLNIKDSGDVEAIVIIEGNFYMGTELYNFYEDLGLSDISNFSVKENGKKYNLKENWNIAENMQEKKYKYGICENEDGIELIWGIGEPGYHKYILNYTLKGAFQNNELKLKIFNLGFYNFEKAQIKCRGNFKANAFATFKNCVGNILVKNKEIIYNVEKVESNNIIIYLNYEGIDNSSYKENVIRIKANNKIKINIILKKVIITLIFLIIAIVFVLFKLKKRKNNYVFIPF